MGDFERDTTETSLCGEHCAPQKQRDGASYSVCLPVIDRRGSQDKKPQSEAIKCQACTAGGFSSSVLSTQEKKNIESRKALK